MKRLILAIGLVILLAGPLPVWTARWVEAKRIALVPQVPAHAESIPACPADDSFFAFLDSPPAASPPTLWRPVCRKSEPPAGMIAIKSEGADSYRHCKAAVELNRPPAVLCWLDPPVDFLANRTADRTNARLTVADGRGREVLWATATPLAWERHLEAEHRRATILGIVIVLFGLAAFHARQTWIRAGGLQRRLAVAGAQPPPRAERLLLCLLPAFNIPEEVDDLRESYEELLTGQGKAEADRWYRSQLRQSAIYYLLQRSRGLLRGAPVRRSTGAG